MTEYQRHEAQDESDRDLTDLARYDPDNDKIEVGPEGSQQTYEVEHARRIRDALDAAIREAETDRWATVWVDDVAYHDEGSDGIYK